jgi:hypothetical protein
MKTTKVTYEMPDTLISGWQVKVAEIMKCHRNTIYLIKKRGRSHPRFNEMMEIVKKEYGKPIKTETV